MKITIGTETGDGAQRQFQITTRPNARITFPSIRLGTDGFPITYCDGTWREDRWPKSTKKGYELMAGQRGWSELKSDWLTVMQI